MPYKFEVFWTQYQYAGELAGLNINLRLRCRTIRDVKRKIASLLEDDAEGVSNIGVKLCETWGAL